MSDFYPTIADVSHHQGDIDWDTAKGYLHFAIIRVQDGTLLDRKLSRNIAACERLGIPYFCYGFYRGGGATEAKRMISRAQAAGAKSVKGYVLDVEVSGLSTSGIKQAFQVLPKGTVTIDGATYPTNGLYIAHNLYKTYGVGHGEGWVWIPRYGSNSGKPETMPAYPCDLWQFTSAGSVPGMSGKIDCNACVNKDLSFFIGGGGTSAPTQPEQPSQPAQTEPTGSTLDLAYRTVRGEFGNGDARKSALGSRYDEVQAFINHISSASSETLAQECRRGDYGNGDVRKALLGSRYSEVQAIINGSSSGGSQYTVVSGDTLSGIGAKLGVAWKSIANANGISSPYTIYPGQKLTIPGGSTGSSPARVYTVKSGDTLSGIGAKLGVSWKGIASKNGIVSPYTIYPGQQLKY